MVGRDCLLQHAQAVLQVDGPECLAELGKRVPAPHVIDQDVQSLVPPFDGGDEFLNLRGLGVIHSYGNAAPAGGRDQFSGFFDRFRTAWRRGTSPRTFSRTAAGAVNRRTRLAQCDGNPSAGTAGSSGNPCDLALQYLLSRSAAHNFPTPDFPTPGSSPSTSAAHSPSSVGR